MIHGSCYVHSLPVLNVCLSNVSFYFLCNEYKYVSAQIERPRLLKRKLIHNHARRRVVVVQRGQPVIAGATFRMLLRILTLHERYFLSVVDLEKSETVQSLVMMSWI